jgi:glycerol-3-phosphate acyltransferase PlsX
MGGDLGPPVVVGGVRDYRRRHGGDGVRFLLHGNEAAIRAEMTRTGLDEAVCDIRHTDKVVAMAEKPAQAMRRGKGSSLWNAIEAVKSGEAGAVVSAGNTGALMAISKLLLRMSAPGLERPAIVAGWPTPKGVTAVLDVGANIESDAEQLVEFAIMGEAFHQAVHGVERPTVGLLNVGSEDVKGHEEVREAGRILREGGLGLSYKGFVEGDDIARGTVDVVVTDGFTGNIMLKSSEAVARLIVDVMREKIMAAPPWVKLGGALVRPALQSLRALMDPSQEGAAPLLGIDGLVFIGHGRSDAVAIKNAIRVARNAVEARVIDSIRDDIARRSAERAASSRLQTQPA